MAGRGDIKRLFDGFAAIKQKFEQVKRDQNKMNEVFQAAQPLQASLQSRPFGRDSLLYKTIPSTLDERQTGIVGQLEQAQRQYRHQARVELVVAMLDEGLAISGRQREQLVRVLVESTRPPRQSGPNDFYVVVVQAAKLPEAKLKPIFDDQQWRLWNQAVRRYAGMEQHLRQQGILDEADK